MHCIERQCLLLLGWMTPIVCVNHICFIDMYIAAHVGCYRLLDKLNNTEINKQISLQDPGFNKQPEMR